MTQIQRDVNNQITSVCFQTSTSHQYIYMYIYIHTCLSTWMLTHIHSYVCIGIHTFIHTKIQGYNLKNWSIAIHNHVSIPPMHLYINICITTRKKNRNLTLDSNVQWHMHSFYFYGFMESNISWRGHVLSSYDSCLITRGSNYFFWGLLTCLMLCFHLKCTKYLKPWTAFIDVLQLVRMC